MFYGTLILAKKGPLAKVWLAAHWDKKLTKAHVFETDVESTVDNIISPGVKLALRTSGHLLLGVVRIYSRKQKYLIQDLGEACAKIKMAFRPGIIDLPSATRAENSDSLALPEIFHDFSDSTAEMGVLQAQFTVNPSRVSEINIPEDHGSGWENTFGTGFDAGNFAADEQLQDFTDISDPSILRDNEVSADIQANELSKDENESALGPIKPRQDDSSIQANDFPQFADAVNDFGEPIDGAGAEFIAFPLQELSNETSAEATKLEPEKEKEASKAEDDKMEVEEEGGEQPEATVAENGEAEPMAVDPAAPEVVEEQHEPEAVTTLTEATPAAAAATTATAEQSRDSSFVLEPVNVTPTVVERNKRKRRVVLDNDKEFSGQQIKSQFEDYNDLLQPKCFPPPTKKAMMWREMAGCEQLYSNPTFPGLTKPLKMLIKGNYTTSLDFADFPLDTSLLDEEQLEPIMTSDKTPQAPGDEQENQKELEEEPPAVTELPDNMAAPEEVPPVIEEPELTKPDEPEAITSELEPARPDEPADIGFTDDAGQIAVAALETAGETDLEDMRANAEPSDENMESTAEQLSNELSEEYEQRRWTKHTQQVVQVLDRKLRKTDTVAFSSLTTKSDRKMAASQFYTCLLLAKEGIIAVEQSEPYAEINIQKGPKYVGVV